jgi:hypothetical protein
MPFGFALRVTLLLLAVICFLGIAIFAFRIFPGRSGFGILVGGVIVLCSFVETVVVPVAAYRLIRYKAERLPSNVASTVAGTFATLPFLAVWYMVNHS